MGLKQLMIRSNGGFGFDCDERWISPVIWESPQTDENCGQLAEGSVTCQAVCCLIQCHSVGHSIVQDFLHAFYEEFCLFLQWVA
jgi:hypothetical protein